MKLVNSRLTGTEKGKWRFIITSVDVTITARMPYDTRKTYDFSLKLELEKYISKVPPQE